jgi:hypothetical protein
MRYIHLRLTQKPSGCIQGLDLSRSRVGDIIVVTKSAGRLIAEGCAVEAPASPFLASRIVYPPSRAAAS